MKEIVKKLDIWTALLIAAVLLVAFTVAFNIFTNHDEVSEVALVQEEVILEETVETSEADTDEPGEENQQQDSLAANEVEQEDPEPAPVTTPEDQIEPQEQPVESMPAPEPASVENTSEATVSSAHRATLLAGHNNERNTLGLQPLIWSASVAASAQSWADGLATKGCVLEHDPITQYGENLYYQKQNGGSPELSPGNAVAWWLDEKSDYDYASNTCAPGEVCTHYTQMVWEQSTEIGCGVAVCEAGESHTQIWACRFSPAGNDGSRPY